MGSPNALLLDEPTNDLDIPTLDVLEESLASFEGGLVLVTHDRLMLDRLATVIVALDGEGGVETFADYGQWERAWRMRSTNSRPRTARPLTARPLATRPLTLPSPPLGGEGFRPAHRLDSSWTMSTRAFTCSTGVSLWMP